MSKKKKMAEEVAKTEAEPYGEFPKIASKAVIKQCTLKKEGPDIRFDNLSVSQEQAGILQGLIESGDMVQVTIECVQGNLPFEPQK